MPSVTEQVSAETERVTLTSDESMTNAPAAKDAPSSQPDSPRKCAVSLAQLVMEQCDRHNDEAARQCREQRSPGAHAQTYEEHYLEVTLQIC